MNIIHNLFKPKFFAILFLGFSSGLPLLLTLSTLMTWLSREGIDRSTITLFHGASIAYSIKFLWSFLFDYFKIPYFTQKYGRRSSWLIFTQILLIIAIMFMGLTNPASSIKLTLFATFIVAFLSATQDILIDAYRTEILNEDEQAIGAALNTYGYRIAMFLSGGGALFLADYLKSWSLVYIIMALFIFIGILAVFLLGEPKNYTKIEKNKDKKSLNKTINEMILSPFKDFMTKDKWLLILLFILFYKMPDSVISGILSNFYVSMGFTNTEIAIIVKSFGPIVTLLGIFIGGILASKIGTRKTLLLTAFLIPLSNLVFIVQNHAGYNINILYFVIAIENFAGALSQVVIVAYIASLCNKAYTATQFALLSSISSIGRTFFAIPSGYLVNKLGWDNFFIYSTLLGLPAFFIIIYLIKETKTISSS